MRRFALLLGVIFSLSSSYAGAQNCDGFTDVLLSSPFCPDVAWLKTFGITKGCAPSQFCPTENVSRLQMAAFMHRLSNNVAFQNGGNAFGVEALLGTMDNYPLYAMVNNETVMQLQPVRDPYFGNNPNVIFGMVLNGADIGILGATIAGGGGCNVYNGSCTTNVANGVSGDFATVGGGIGNTAGSGLGATVPGGVYNTASGYASLAAGYGAQATQDRSFVWSGWLFGGAPSFGPNAAWFGGEHGLGVDYYAQRADNGGQRWVYIGDNISGQTIATWTGAFLADGDTWTNASDRALKADFTAVDAQAVLAKVAQLPIDEWRYKAENGQRHLGPVAQDFYAAFGLGADDKHITTVDEGGVALAAIKGLNAKVDAQATLLQSRLESAVQEKNRQLAEQAATIGEQQREISELRGRVSAAESLRGELAALRSAVAEILQERQVTAQRN
jgi:hypothetical protein